VKLLRGYGYVPPFMVERSENMCRWILRLEQKLIPAHLSYVTGLTYLIAGDKGQGCPDL
jgi:hypothetical protein